VYDYFLTNEPDDDDDDGDDDGKYKPVKQLLQLYTSNQKC